MYERAKILRAVNEWNHVLNGFVRFDIDPGRTRSRAWVIVASAAAARHRCAARSSAVRSRLPRRCEPFGGVVIVYVDRVRGYDLVGVMRHELGHVLRLGHDPNGRLMSPRYTARHQQCIDRAAAQAVAANRKLPIAELNWCQSPLSARIRRIRDTGRNRAAR